MVFARLKRSWTAKALILPVLLAVIAGAILRSRDWDADSNFNWAEVPPWAAFRAGMALATYFPLLETAINPPNVRVLGVATGFMHSKALYVAAKLGIADALAAGPQDASVLAAAKEVKADHLRRVLRLLASMGIFRELRPGVFGNNRASGVLRSDHPVSVLDLVLHLGEESYWAHGKMLDAMQLSSPGTAFAMASGEQSLWDWYHKPEHREAGERFDRAMVNLNSWSNPPLLQDYDWAQHANQTLADVGGGLGAVLSAVLAQQPGMRGVLFDLPPVVDRARELWRSEHPGFLPRVEFVGGDLFQAVPRADVYFLQQILHDWSDEESVRILQTLRRAMVAAAPAGVAPGSAGPLLLISEIVMDDAQPVGLMKASPDLQMMAMVGGKERSHAEWRALLAAGGFTLQRVVPIRSMRSLIVAAPVAD